MGGILRPEPVLMHAVLNRKSDVPPHVVEDAVALKPPPRRVQHPL